MDEHAAIADQVMAEQAAEDRVVPGLGQLIVQTRVDQADVRAFDQRPLRHLQQHLGVECLMQPGTDFADLFLVEVDPRRRGALGLLPLSLLEAGAGTDGDLAKMLTVIVEAIEDHPGDIGGRPVLGHTSDLCGNVEA
ncbi:hypothetical protein D3C77_510840 [compost metagenome]